MKNGKKNNDGQVNNIKRGKKCNGGATDEFGAMTSLNIYIKKGEKNKAIDHMNSDQSTHSISGLPVSIFHIQQQYQRPL